MLRQSTSGSQSSAVKAVALYSGGLDSMLCAKTLLHCGIEVLGLTILVPSFIQARASRDKLLASAASIGLPLEIIDISEEYLAMVKSPVHGYGSAHNPCIDCKILFLKKAKEKMERDGARFVATGEVLGQRPMSQNRRTMYRIERHAGLEGYVLRPLCALVLEPTVAEKEGWVDRTRLHRFSGRGRRDQMNLAREYGITGYPTPGGGCLLTEKAFSRRFSDLVEHGHCDLKNVQLLKIGRHFRFSKAVKLVVGRNEQENRRIEELAHEGDHVILGDRIPGPVGLLRGCREDDFICLETACSMVARYYDKTESGDVPVVIKSFNGEGSRVLRVSPASEELLATYRICHA